MHKIKLLLTTILLSSYSVFSQIKPINVGEMVPASVIKDYLGKVKGVQNLQGKLIILDFWNRTCASCIEAMPKMNKIQERFNDKVQVFLVTKDTPEELKRLYEVSENVKNNKLPNITGDKILNELFPHKAEPFHVWISPDGKVYTKITGVSTTEENISKYLNNRSLSLPVRNDDPNIDQVFPLLDQLYEHKLKDQLVSYYIFTKSHRGTPKAGRAILSKNKKMTGLAMLNYPISTMLTTLMPAADSLYFDVIMDSKDSAKHDKYFAPENKSDDEKWRVDNEYCFEIKFSDRILNLPTEKEKFKQAIALCKSLIEDQFSIKSSIQKIKKECYVMHLSPQKIDSLKTKAGTPSSKFIDDEGIFDIRNKPISFIEKQFSSPFIYDITRKKEDIPVIIDKKIRNINIDFTINCKDELLTPEVVKRELLKNGFYFTKEINEVTYLVITEI